MKIPKIKKWQLIEIHWIDSIHSGGWKDSAKLDDGEKNVDHLTVGYFVEGEKRTICVVQSVQCFIDKTDNSRFVDAQMRIPKVAISRIRFLK